MHFNSIKVRLEHPDFAAQVLAHLFQFHKGAIRTYLPVVNILHLPNFNSIKVRLELIVQDTLVAVLIFQFHKGAIRTLWLQSPFLPCADFNSIKVRLEPGDPLQAVHQVCYFNSIKVRLERFIAWIIVSLA